MEDIVARLPDQLAERVALQNTLFDAYMRAQDDDTLYAHFSAQGTLANRWPAFEDVHSLNVTVRVISVDQKPYITEVAVGGAVDGFFRVALLLQTGDKETMERMRELVNAWIHDFGPRSNA